MEKACFCLILQILSRFIGIFIFTAATAAGNQLHKPTSKIIFQGKKLKLIFFTSSNAYTYQIYFTRHPLFAVCFRKSNYR